MRLKKYFFNLSADYINCDHIKRLPLYLGFTYFKIDIKMFSKLDTDSQVGINESIN